MTAPARGIRRRINKRGGAMRHKAYENKYAVLLIAMLVILGLVLPACTCGEIVPPEEPVAEEPAAPAEVSFEAAEYKNVDYGFSVKYPADWAEQEATVETTVFYVQ